MDEDIAPPPFILRFSPHTKIKNSQISACLCLFLLWFDDDHVVCSKDYQQAKRYHEMDL